MRRRTLLSGLAGIMAAGYAPSFAHAGILMPVHQRIERRPVKWVDCKLPDSMRIVHGFPGNTLTLNSYVSLSMGDSEPLVVPVSATMPTGRRKLAVEGLRVPFYLDNFQFGTAEIDYTEIR